MCNLKNCVHGTDVSPIAEEKIFFLAKEIQFGYNPLHTYLGVKPIELNRTLHLVPA